MKNRFYTRLAAQNLRKHARLYVPRVLAEAGLLGCFYILITLAMDRRLSEAVGGAYLSAFMAFGALVIGLLSLILILYVNSFLMKRRRAEYGLYNVLGMEKRHVMRVLLAESCSASLLSILLGLLFGALLYKLCSLLICRLLRAGVVAGFYYLSAPTLLASAILFLAMDGIAFLASAAAVYRMKPVELLSGRHAGEREPRVKWLLLVLGALTLGAGYFIALTTKSPLQALLLFFAAVLLVIVGTYCLYLTGSTFVLKCLRKNRRYYYTSRHMPAVAGLLFRMKQNAVGLASIAILATGVLVMISTTVSLYGGVQDTLDTNYPRQLYLSAHVGSGDAVEHVPFDALSAVVAEAAAENGVEISDVEREKLLTVSYLMEGDRLLTREEAEGGWRLEDLTDALFITEETYAQLRGKGVRDDPDRLRDPETLGLAKGEIAFCRIATTVDDLGREPRSLTIHGREYKIKQTLTYFPVSRYAAGNIIKSVGIVVADGDVLDGIYRAQKAAYGEHASEYISRIGVSFADEAAASAAGTAISAAIAEKLRAAYPGELSYELDTKWESLHNMLDMYGTFLFLGILLGFVCLFATILIIYYKQISEGYEDRERFQIMEKVGMEPREVRRAIGSQLVLQFFLPLVTAAVHTAAAFPILLKLLRLLMLTNTTLFVLCTLVTLAVFSMAYAAVYLLTARTYYRIVH